MPEPSAERNSDSTTTIRVNRRHHDQDGGRERQHAEQRDELDHALGSPRGCRRRSSAKCPAPPPGRSREEGLRRRRAGAAWSGPAGVVAAQQARHLVLEIVEHRASTLVVRARRGVGDGGLRRRVRCGVRARPRGSERSCSAGCRRGRHRAQWHQRFRRGGCLVDRGRATRGAGVNSVMLGVRAQHRCWCPPCPDAASGACAPARRGRRPGVVRGPTARVRAASPAGSSGSGATRARRRDAAASRGDSATAIRRSDAAPAHARPARVAAAAHPAIRGVPGQGAAPALRRRAARPGRGSGVRLRVPATVRRGGAVGRAMFDSTTMSLGPPISSRCFDIIATDSTPAGAGRRDWRGRARPIAARVRARPPVMPSPPNRR